MDPLTIGLGGVGLLSGILGNSAKQRQMKAQMMTRAAEQEAAPWTGQAAQTQANFDGGSWGNLLQGVGGGVGMAQGIKSAGQQEQLNSLLGKKAESDMALNSAWLDMLKQKQSGDMMANSQQLPAKLMSGYTG